MSRGRGCGCAGLAPLPPAAAVTGACWGEGVKERAPLALGPPSGPPCPAAPDLAPALLALPGGVRFLKGERFPNRPPSRWGEGLTARPSSEAKSGLDWV